MYNIRKKALSEQSRSILFTRQFKKQNRAYFRHLLHVCPLTMPVLDFPVFSLSKNLKFACYLGELHLQIALSLLHYSLLIHTVHMPYLSKLCSQRYCTNPNLEEAAADYIRKTAPISAQLGVPKTSQVSRFFFNYMTKTCPRSINELKADQKYLFIIALNIRRCFYNCNFSNILYLNDFIQ